MKDFHLINLRFLEITLRLSALPLTVASAFMAAKANDSSHQYGNVEFAHISCLKFLLSMNCISAPYALISAILLASVAKNRAAWAFFLSDQIIAYLMVTSSSSAMELLYLAREGDREVSWGEVCSYHGEFCGRAKASLVLHSLALLCFVCLSLISGLRAFSSSASDMERRGSGEN